MANKYNRRGTAFTDMPAATSSTYTVSGITAGMNGNQYRCVVSGACTPAATSSAATLTVVTSVGVTTQPISTIVCDGGTTSFTVAGSGPGIIYQWQVNTGSGFVNVPAAAPYSGTTSATLTITGATTAMNNISTVASYRMLPVQHRVFRILQH